MNGSFSVESPSSHTTNTTPAFACAYVMMRGSSVLSQVSPCVTSSVEVQPEAPCMSWHRFGVMNVKLATSPAARSEANALYARWCDSQYEFVADGGLPETSWKKTNGSCLAA